MRESHAAELMELLKGRGALAEHANPHVPVSPKMREYHFNLESVEPISEKIAGYDMLLLVAAHKILIMIWLKNALLIIDVRGVYQKPANNIVKA